MLARASRFLFCFSICVFIFMPSYAYDDCINFKTSPKTNVTIPEWKKEVVQPLRAMDLLHGNVIASMTEAYNLEVEMESIEDGFCIVLTKINAYVGYTNFLVQIDARHVPGSCAYDATLEHEDMHIRAHLSVIDDNEKSIKSAISAAAESIMPIFVKDQKNAERAIDTMNEQIQNNPSIILMKQKIKADAEIKNKKIDQNTDSSKIKNCDW